MMAVSAGNLRLQDMTTEIALLKQAVEGLRGDLVTFGASVTETLKQHGTELRGLQTEHIQRCGNVSILEQHVSDVEQRITGRVDKLETRVTEIEKLVPVIRAVMWILGLLGASVVALIWSLITGQAQILVP